LRLGSYDCSRYLRRKTERLLSQTSSRGILEYSLRLTIAYRLVGRLYGLPSETLGSSSNEHVFLRHSFTSIYLVRATAVYQPFASTCTCHSGLSAVLSVLVCAVVAYQRWSALEPALNPALSLHSPTVTVSPYSIDSWGRQTVRSQLLETLHMLTSLSDTR
jgi:hypothetical protein